MAAVGGYRLEHQLLAADTEELLLYTAQEVLQEVGQRKEGSWVIIYAIITSVDKSHIAPKKWQDDKHINLLTRKNVIGERQFLLLGT